MRSLLPGLHCLLSVTLSMCLIACTRTPTALPQQAYIWQRQWTPAVTAAMHSSAPLLQGWRVLAAELTPQREWKTALPDWSTLRATRAPLVMVVRLDGGVDLLDGATRSSMLELLTRWRGQGLQVSGIEIDYDCATARLPAYRAFLSSLRRALPAATTLSITALPTWLTSPELPALLALPDESVLQVHAVMNPRQGLFDPLRAQAWMQSYARQTRRPWRVALPSYSTRVSWDEQGRISAVESERALLNGGNTAQELVAAPAVISAFVAQLERDPAPRLSGIVWFRLPTERDARAWSLATWQTVLARRPLLSTLQVETPAADDDDKAGLHDIVLRNDGNADRALPLMVRIDSACSAADGINGYALEADARGQYLRRTRDGLLRAGYRRNIGWLRCQQNPIQLHAEY